MGYKYNPFTKKLSPTGGNGASESFNGNRTVKRTGLPAINAGGETLKEWVESYFFPAVAPVLNVNNFPNQEKGTSLNPVIAGTVVKNDGTLVQIRIKKGSTVIHTINTPGASYSYTDAAIIANTTYTVELDYQFDGGAIQTITLSRVCSFYAPGYHGAGVPGLTEAEIKGLSKALRTSRTAANLSFTALNNRFYYVYPASYGTITQINNQNGFNITDGWSLVGQVTFTLADGVQTELMNIYMGNDNTTQTGFKISFQ